jgi:thiol:disulfide interchange protein DsbA
MNRRDFSSALLAAGAAAPLAFAGAGARAQGAAPAEGRDFTRVDPPQPTAAAGKIEVLAFFSYACPHCNVFEPTIAAWAKGQPADVAFRRVPVPFLYNADVFQHTFYALETNGLVDALQTKIFYAVHVEKQRLDKPEDVAALVARNGGDAARFLAAYKSFSVATSVARAKKTTAEFKIDGVPALAVAGRFLTSPEKAGGGPQSLAVVDALIQRVRKG